MCRCTKAKSVIFITIFLASLLIANSVSAVSKKDDFSFDFPLKTKTIVKGFVAPAFQYGPGHRGVAFAAKPGTDVYASAEGRVIFAGLVAGKLHVTLSHGTDFKTTYTNLKTKNVAFGELVTKGQLIGITGAGVNKEFPDSFLFTIRYRDAYVDPLKYLNKKIIERKIYLAKFQETSSDISNDTVSEEKSVIAKLIESSNPHSRIEDFHNYLVKVGIDQLKAQSSKSINSYVKAVKKVEEVKFMISQINYEISRGIKDGYTNGTKKLKKLEKELMKTLAVAFEEIIKLNKSILKLYGRSLEISTQAANWFLESISDLLFLPLEMGRNLSLLIYDLIDSSKNSTLKVLNQYANYDMQETLRTIVIPGSCLLESCSRAIILKCNPNAKSELRTPKDGYKGSKNSLFVVAGLGTSANLGVGGELNPSLDLPISLLGYKQSDVSYFSYSSHGQGYDQDDTYEDLNVAAKSMDEQIKEFKKQNQGKKLDITTHSLGGAVTALWLAKYYSPKDQSYPKLGKVIMLAPPVNGTALAKGREILASQEDGQAFLNGVGKLVPRVLAQSVEQVTEDGFVSDNTGRHLNKVDIQTIRLAPDLIVTSATRSPENANEIVFPSSDLLNSHSGIIKDKNAIVAMQHFLEGTKPPCVSFKDSFKSIGQASVVRSSELFISRSIRDSADVQNLEEVSKFISTISN